MTTTVNAMLDTVEGCFKLCDDYFCCEADVNKVWPNEEGERGHFIFTSSPESCDALKLRPSEKFYHFIETDDPRVFDSDPEPGELLRILVYPAFYRHLERAPKDDEGYTYLTVARFPADCPIGGHAS